jgi:hypothetical protein
MSELLKINVNEHTEKKGQLTYLSWAWAWAEILKIDPQATWVAHEFGPDGCQVPMMILPDTTAMVKVGVTISGHYKQCLLPVMDNRNKAIPGPDAFQVNTAIMRCLAKAIAMHGLGLYIYAGEDLPEQDFAPLDRLVADMVQLNYEEKNTVQAVKLWYENNLIQSSNDAREYAWMQLKEYSALRSAIKANKPELKAA